MDGYPFEPDKWGDTPIVRTINPLTGYLEGEDGDNPATGNPGFREMKTLAQNNEPLVEANIHTRSVLGGYDEYGNPYNAELALPGGLEGERLVVRESVARFLDYAGKLLTNIGSGSMELTLLDGFESYIRQSAGFSRVLKQLLDKANIQGDPSASQIHELGKLANGTYCYVSADKNSAEYKGLESELRANSILMQELEQYAQSQLQPGEILNKKVERILFEVITIFANSKMGPAQGKNIPLNFENNAHAGGGAVDVMVIDGKGNLMSLTPYLWVGEEAGMDYMEDDANYYKFLATAKKNPDLAKHLAKLGYLKPENFTFTDWVNLRNVRRVRYHLFKALGATYYSAHNGTDGGEDWHQEPGNRLWTPDGRIIHAASTANQYPDSGNPGHTLQKIGPDGIAVWGGRSAHILAQKNHGLVIPN